MYKITQLIIRNSPDLATLPSSVLPESAYGEDLVECGLRDPAAVAVQSGYPRWTSSRSAYVDEWVAQQQQYVRARQVLAAAVVEASAAVQSRRSKRFKANHSAAVEKSAAQPVNKRCRSAYSAAVEKPVEQSGRRRSKSSDAALARESVAENPKFRTKNTFVVASGKGVTIRENGFIVNRTPAAATATATEFQPSSDSTVKTVSLSANERHLDGFVDFASVRNE